MTKFGKKTSCVSQNPVHELFYKWDLFSLEPLRDKENRANVQANSGNFLVEFVWVCHIRYCIIFWNS